MKYIIIFLFTSNAFSQEIAFVNYIVIPKGGTLENSEDVKKSKILAPGMIGVDEELKKLNFELFIKEDKSYYRLISSLDRSVTPARYARVFAGASDFYQDRTKNEIIKVFEFSGEAFNIKQDNNQEWVLTSETKIIGEYECFKATRKKITRIKKTIMEVVAWYCPTIPLSFGPKEFGGLPGLILELTDNKITYLANKIELNKKIEVKFKEIKGKIITEDEFDKIYNESVSKLFGDVKFN